MKLFATFSETSEHCDARDYFRPLEFRKLDGLHKGFPVYVDQCTHQDHSIILHVDEGHWVVRDAFVDKDGKITRSLKELEQTPSEFVSWYDKYEHKATMAIGTISTEENAKVQITWEMQDDSDDSAETVKFVRMCVDTGSLLPGCANLRGKTSGA